MNEQTLREVLGEDATLAEKVACMKGMMWGLAEGKRIMEELFKKKNG